MQLPAMLRPGLAVSCSLRSCLEPQGGALRDASADLPSGPMFEKRVWAMFSFGPCQAEEEEADCDEEGIPCVKKWRHRREVNCLERLERVQRANNAWHQALGHLKC